MGDTGGAAHSSGKALHTEETNPFAQQLSGTQRCSH